MTAVRHILGNDTNNGSYNDNDQQQYTTAITSNNNHHYYNHQHHDNRIPTKRINKNTTIIKIILSCCNITTSTSTTAATSSNPLIHNPNYFHNQHYYNHKKQRFGLRTWLGVIVVVTISIIIIPRGVFVNTNSSTNGYFSDSSISDSLLLINRSTLTSSLSSSSSSSTSSVPQIATTPEIQSVTTELQSSVSSSSSATVAAVNKDNEDSSYLPSLPESHQIRQQPQEQQQEQQLQQQQQEQAEQNPPGSERKELILQLEAQVQQNEKQFEVQELEEKQVDAGESIINSSLNDQIDPPQVSSQQQRIQQQSSIVQSNNNDWIESDNDNNNNEIFSSGLTSSQSSSSLLSDIPGEDGGGIVRMLPIQSPFGLCWNKIAKVSCETTILVEDMDYDIAISRVSNPSGMMDILCDTILLQDDSGLPTTTDGTGDTTVVLPICIQYYNNSFSIPITLIRKDLQSKIELLQSIESSEQLQGMVNNANNNDTKIRMLPLKYVDFPFYYHGMNTDDIESIRWTWEKYRDENFGNMVWRYASTMLLNPLSTHYTLNDAYNETILQVPPNGRPFDTYLIATANTLHLTVEPQLQDFVEYLTRRIQRWNVPTVVVGIGIQFEFTNHINNNNNNKQKKRSNYKNMNIDMQSLDETNQQQNYQNYNLALYHNFQKEFLQQISYRQTIPAIGVRGDLTKSVCDNSGITSCISMGCPSLTISHHVHLGRKLQRYWNKMMRLLRQKKTFRVAVTFPAYGGSNVVYTVVEMICLLVEMYSDVTETTITLIQQDSKDSIRLEKYINDKWRTNHPNSVLNISMVNIVEYYNVESWLHDARTKYDLCISSRIHGSMTFISSGIPTVAIPTDFRIMELLHSMKVPYILPTQLQRIVNSWNKNSPEQRYNNNQFITSIMQQATNRNFTVFEVNRRSKIKQWQSILQENGGIEINPALLKILQTPLNQKN